MTSGSGCKGLVKGELDVRGLLLPELKVMIALGVVIPCHTAPKGAIVVCA